MRRLLAPLVAALAAASALAQEGDYPAKLKNAESDRTSVQAGGTFSVKVDVEVDAGWHVYGLEQSPDAGVATTISAAGEHWPDGLKPGKPTESPAPKSEKSSIGVQLVHEGKVSFTLPFTVSGDAAPGSREIKGHIDLQACDASSCKAPQSFDFTAYVEVSPVRIVRAEVSLATVAPGGEASVEIELAIAKGFHVYAQKHAEYKPPTFEWKLPTGWVKKGDLVESTPPHEEDEYGIKLFVHTDKAVLRQTFAVAADAKPGPVELTALGSWQRCDDKGCTDDHEFPLSAKATVAGAAAAPAANPIAPAANPKPPAPSPKDDAPAAPAPAAEEDLVSTLLSGAGWGLLTILTPCVFPLLPVTVSFFSKQRGSALPRSFVYWFGIVFTFVVIGLVFKEGLDRIARGPWFNGFVGVLFIALSLSLFGLFDLRLPGFLIDRSQSRAGPGLLGAFFMAVTLALTSFSCSAPFLAIMFSRFEQGDQTKAIAGLFAYGATVGLPFFLCSLFPALLKTLPGSGGWMNAVKVTMGFVEFGLAFKFLRTVALNMGSDMLPDSLVLALWCACALGAAIYLFGFLTLPHDTKVEGIGVFRLLFALFFLMLALWFVPGIFGRSLTPAIDGFLQRDPAAMSAAPLGGPGAAVETARIEWGLNEWDGALARAAEKKRPALFDFTGVG